MAAGGGGGSAAGDLGPVWIIVGIFIFGFMFWYFARAEIVSVYFSIKRFEIDVIQFFIKGLETETLERVKIFITNAVPANTSFASLSYVASEVGYYLRFPISIILIILSIILFYKSSAHRFRHTYSMSSLLKSEVKTWPQCQPTMGLDLLGANIEKGPWAMAITPMGFAKRYHLVKENITEKRVDQLSIKEHITVSLLRDRAARIFAMQLGRPWQGVEALNTYTKALFAAFAAKAARDSEASRNLLYQLSASAQSGSLDYSGVDVLLKKHKNHPAVKEIIDKHGYVLTVMASMLKLARLDGVLSTAEFIWLKPLDRKLWFMLNAVGRQTATAEIGGAYAHWLAEIELGRTIRTPMVEQAVKALDLALQEVIYDPKSDW